MFLDHKLLTPVSGKTDRSRNDVDSVESGMDDGFGRPLVFYAKSGIVTLRKHDNEAVYMSSIDLTEMVTERVGDRPEEIRGRSPGDGPRQ